LLAGVRKRCTGVYKRALWWSLSGENKKRIFIISFLLRLLAQSSHKSARKCNYLLVSRAFLLVWAFKRCTGVYNRALWWSLRGENKKRILILSLLLGLWAQCSHKFARKCNYLLVSRAVLLARARKRSRGVYNRALWWSFSGENKKRIFIPQFVTSIVGTMLHIN
jgi:hypothetical protein